MEEARAPQGLVERIAFAWRAPRASYAYEWPEASEARLLAYAFGASIFLTLGPIAAEAVLPAEAFGDDRPPWFAARILVGLSFLPLGLYAVAAIATLGCRVARSGAEWRRTRLALFWSGVAAGPMSALYPLGALFDATDVGGALFGVAWTVLFAPMLAAAHGFKTSSVVVIFSTIALVVFALRLFG